MTPQPKIPPKRCPSDTCRVFIGEAAYAVHEGEWVDIIPALSIEEVILLSSMEGVAQSPDPQAAQRAFEGFCQHLSRRLVAWNWTDLVGQPLPPPFGAPEVLARLTADELLWLVQASRHQEEDRERKNGSGPSPSTFSAAAPSPGRPS